MVRWKNKKFEEKDPRYFWFAVADTLRQLAVYVEEAGFSDKDLAIQYAKQIVGLLTEIARETVKAYYDERVWVPVYDLLMEFVGKNPYDDVISEFEELKGLVELRDRLDAMVEEVEAKAKEVKREMEEWKRKEKKFSKRRDDLPF
jgi:flagellar biosynthesis/type III secretory pathway protein FliH